MKYEQCKGQRIKYFRAIEVRRNGKRLWWIMPQGKWVEADNFPEEGTYHSISTSVPIKSLRAAKRMARKKLQNGDIVTCIPFWQKHFIEFIVNKKGKKNKSFKFSLRGNK